MRRRSLFFALPLSLALAACAGEAPSDAQSRNGDVIPGRFIVQLDRDALPSGIVMSASLVETVAQDLKLNVASFQHDLVYAHTIQGFAIEATDAEVARLAADPRVLRIEPDRVITINAPPWCADNPSHPACAGDDDGGDGGSTQTTPWGITRVGGAIDGTGKTAWVIDSGIDLDHPDLNVDLARSKNFVTKGKDTADDGNGHGTHVAGTIGAIDNDRDVVGVAPNASLVAVRVLDNNGSGSYSGVIAGVDYVGANGTAGDVANMSLGGPVSQTLDDAVIAASNNGIWFSLAAGNDGGDANDHSPARANGAYIVTISATDSSDVMASWSNWGNPPVDWAAPGVSILSTWKGAGTNTISGTSMAAPHVAGLLLLGDVTADGTALEDPDGNPDPIAHN